MEEDYGKYKEYYPSNEISNQMRAKGYEYFRDMYLAKYPEQELIPIMNFMGNPIINAFGDEEFLYAYCLENNITWLQLLGIKENEISEKGVIY